MKNMIPSVNEEVILKRIREARIKEELAVPIYTSHIEQTLFWSGLPKEKQVEIIAKLRILEEDSERHAKLLKNVEKIYLKSLK